MQWQHLSPAQAAQLDDVWRQRRALEHRSRCALVSYLLPTLFSVCLWCVGDVATLPPTWDAYGVVYSLIQIPALCIALASVRCRVVDLHQIALPMQFTCVCAQCFVAWAAMRTSSMTCAATQMTALAAGFAALWFRALLMLNRFSSLFIG